MLKLLTPLLTILLLAAFSSATSAQNSSARTNLVQAILSENPELQLEIIRSLVDANDPSIKQDLEAWRGGVVYIYKANDLRIPILLDAQTDAEGRSAGLRISDGSPIKDENGEVLMLSSLELLPADANSKLRKAIKTTLDIFALGNPNPNMRRDAATKLGQEQNPEYLPYFKDRLAKEESPQVRTAIEEAIAITEIASVESVVRLAAIQKLNEMRSINGLTFLQKVRDAAKEDPAKYGDQTLT